MGLTFQLEDPETGQKVWLTAYRRNGRIVYQRLAAHVFKEGFTLRRRENLDRFGRAASLARGSRMLQGVPPASLTVQAEFRDHALESAPSSVSPSKSIRAGLPLKLTEELKARIETLYKELDRKERAESRIDRRVKL